MGSSVFREFQWEGWLECFWILYTCSQSLRIRGVCRSLETVRGGQRTTGWLQEPPGVKKKPLEGLLQGMVRKIGPGNQNGARRQGDPVVGSSGVCTTMTDDQGVPGPQGFSAALDL